MTKRPRTPPSLRPSERFPWKNPNLTNAQLRKHVERLAAENDRLERQNEKLAKDNASLAREASANPVTGGMNERALFLQLAPIHEAAIRHMEQARRLGKPLPSNAGYAVLAIDLNKFKAVNDTKGHVEGDKVLCNVHDVLVSGSRRTDLVSHPHGDEFVIVLTEVDRETAITLARKILQNIEQAGFQHGVTASIGLAHFDPLTMAAKTPKQMVELADMGLIKTNGRNENVEYQNRIVLVTPQGEKIVIANDMARSGAARPVTMRPGRMP